MLTRLKMPEKYSIHGLNTSDAIFWPNFIFLFYSLYPKIRGLYLAALCLLNAVWTVDRSNQTVRDGESVSADGCYRKSYAT